jgi:Rad3-related DNA helicase
VDVMDLLVETDLYNFDFEKLHGFFDKADLIKKLNGFMQSNATAKSPTPFSRSILYQIKEFIRILSLNPSDGKFILRSKPSKSIEYICLNPALHLKRLMDQADKIILASGTLEPTEEYDVLDKYVTRANYMYKFACDHVISQDNYKVVALGSFNQH